MTFSESEKKNNTCAVLTAAGCSSRMGDFKPLLPFGNSFIAASCVDRLRRAGVSEIIVVIGHRSGELRAALESRSVCFSENPDYRTTEMFDSLKRGLASVSRDCKKIVVQPIDLPAILPQTIAALLREDGQAVRPTYHGKSGHPIVLDASILPQILAYGGGDGLRGALRAPGISVRELPVEDEGVLLDADTNEDYVNLLRLQEQRTRTVYLFRHGLPAFPGGVRCCLGLTPDLPLSAQGAAEAKSWRDFLPEQRISGIYSSPALRCRETARAMVGDSIPISVVDAFHELCYGVWEGMALEEIRTKYPALYSMREQNMSLMPPGGESVEAAGERSLGALLALMEKTDGNLAAVAHAGWNRALLCRITGTPLQEIGQFRQDYNHMNILAFDGISFALRSCNQSPEQFT